MRINYHESLRQAKKIQELGEDLKRLSQKIDHLRLDIPNTWRGIASDEYMKECQILLNKMSKTSKEIINVSSTIKRVAEKIHQEDLEQARRAKSMQNK